MDQLEKDKIEFDKQARKYFLLVFSPLVFLLLIYGFAHKEQILFAFVFISTLFLSAFLLVPKKLYPEAVRHFLSMARVCILGLFFGSWMFLTFYSLLVSGHFVGFWWGIILLALSQKILMLALFCAVVQWGAEVFFRLEMSTWHRLVLPVMIGPIVFFILKAYGLVRLCNGGPCISL